MESLRGEASSPGADGQEQAAAAPRHADAVDADAAGDDDHEAVRCLAGAGDDGADAEELRVHAEEQLGGWRQGPSVCLIDSWRKRQSHTLFPRFMRMMKQWTWKAFGEVGFRQPGPNLGKKEGGEADWCHGK